MEPRHIEIKKMPGLYTAEDIEKIMGDNQLRHYQVELIKYARRKNSIIFLPTGCGKTFIAIGILKSRIKDLKMTEENNRKVAVFMGTTVPLVKQLAKVVQENTNLEVKFFVGEMGIDTWNAKTWCKELLGCQVICSTPIVILQLLQAKIIPLDKISFLVLDECHHATLNHPYNKVLKEFDYCEEKDRPLILGLTATILNGNPKGDCLKEINTLKSNMRSSFARTVLLDEAMKCGTSPKDLFVTYVEDNGSDTDAALIKLLNNMTNTMRSYNFNDKIHLTAKKVVPDHCVLLHNTNKIAKEILHIIRSLEDVLKELGLYAMNLAALYYIIRLERLRLMKNSTAVILFIKWGITMLNVIRRKILKILPSDILKGSSTKVRSLLNFVEGELENRAQLSCIILVEQKVTALIMSTLFNQYSKQKGNDYFNANYITGGLFNVVKEPKECFFEMKHQNDVLSRFRNSEYHFLFATQIIEEGIDVPKVNVGILFDGNISFRTFVQFKGRVRDKSGQFVIFTKHDILESVNRTAISYNNVYKKLLQSIHLFEEYDEDLNDSDDGDDEVYFLNGPDGAHITAIQAIGYLIRYCSFLPQDEYATLCPLCWFDPLERVAFLRMPPACPVNYTIKGDVRSSRKKAKRNVYLKALKELHKAKEINDDLTIRSYSCNEDVFLELLPNVEKEIIEKGLFQANENKIKRSYEIKFPENLSGCTPQPGCCAYLHYIKFTAKDERPLDSRRGKLYDLLCSPDDFVILSSKRLSKICDFPIFSRFGEFTCSVVINAGMVTLRASELELIRKFHFFLFNSVLAVVSRIQVLDRSNEGLSFYVVPVKHQNDKELFINWNVIKEFAPQAETTEMSEMYCQDPNIEDYYESVVYPKYRKTHCAAGYYVVTSLDRTQTPLSEFPSEDFKNYCEYYEKKYDTRISNTSQPLLEVKSIFSRANYVVPRAFSNSKNRRKFQEDDDFREFLVPELCCKLTFPASIWLKATLLPSALHRITTIYSIDDMRKRIASDTGLGIVNVDDDHKWQPLQNLNPQFMFDYSSKNKRTIPTQESCGVQLPIDIFRRITECAPCDLKHYLNYFNIEAGDSYHTSVALKKNKTPLENIRIPDLKFPFEVEGKPGPELIDFIKVFTCKSAVDLVDLERLEFLGDAFLKFSVSFYLFRKFKFHEGVLTKVKGSIVSNKNLYYSALSKELEGPLLVNQFDPTCVWVAPLFTLPEEIKNQVNEEKFEVEYLFEISAKEKLEGKLTPANVKNIRDSAVNERSGYAVDESLFCRKTIRDKSLADCVEALLGLYVKDFGLRGGFAILNWMNIISPADGSYDLVIGKKWEPPRKDISEILNDEVAYNDLEEIIGYEFKNKIILLEALTHPSCIDSATESYQRLEFLGDSLIDFMVSIYIYNYGNHLNPGDMTDIRMGLVNNTTFASATVKHNLHKHLLHTSERLLNAINCFANYQKLRDNEIIADPINFYYEEGEPRFGDSIEVPKALGDVFESLIGAVYLDSGNSLEIAWEVYYRMMNGVLEEFCRNPPMSPIRLIYEKCNPLPEFRYEFSEGLMKCYCKIIHNGEEKVFCGRGKGSGNAKFVASKVALRFLESSKAKPA